MVKSIRDPLEILVAMEISFPGEFFDRKTIGKPEENDDLTNEHRDFKWRFPRVGLPPNS